MENIEIIKFEIEDLCMDIRVSMEEKTAWLSLNDLSKLFKRSKSAISRCIKKILEEAASETNSVVAKNGSVVAKNTPVVAKSETTAEDGKRYKINRYNLTTAILLGDKIKSDRGELLKMFVDDHFKETDINNSNHIIIYNNGNISIDVNVSPEEETVWLNQRQIAELFGITQQNVSLHINNILEEGELENTTTEESSYTDSVHKENLYTGRCGKKNLHVLPSVSEKNSHTEIYQKEIRHIASDGKEYSVTFYNLDMILAIGYRVKSGRAIQFRRWASSILKEYLIKGYALDEKRTLVTDDNYIHLIHKVNSIDDRVTKIENEWVIDNEKLFFDGAYYDSRAFIQNLIAKASESVVLIDSYSDSKTLGFFAVRKPNVSLKIYTSSFAKLNKDDIVSFNSQYGGLEVFVINTFHDRFIILDNKEIYQLGASLNFVGKKSFAILAMDNRDAIPKIIQRLNEQANEFIIS